ncbi:MAG: hypothetical protein Q4D91_03545 [Lautropia sp.]|nr:hypothetical protein [Lautropia sp.]
MSKPPFFRTLSVAGLTALMSLGLPAKAADDSANTGITIEVRNGDQAVRQFQLDEQHVVQFAGPETAHPPELRSASQTERKQLKSLSAGTATSSLSKAADGAQVSPVLRDASGKPWALPGGLIVTFREAVSETDARAQLSAAGLTPDRAINPQVWLAKSPSGLATIELANLLNEQALFADVSPNWWTPRALK